MTITIKHISNASAVDAGHTVSIGVTLADGRSDSLHVPTHAVPVLIRALMEASIVADVQKKLQPGEKAEVEIPYRARDAVTGHSQDGTNVAIKFLSAIGFPLVVSMAPSLAQRTIERLTLELQSLGRRSPSRVN